MRTSSSVPDFGLRKALWHRLNLVSFESCSPQDLLAVCSAVKNVPACQALNDMSGSKMYLSERESAL